MSRYDDIHDRLVCSRFATLAGSDSDACVKRAESVKQVKCVKRVKRKLDPGGGSSV